MTIRDQIRSLIFDSLKTLEVVIEPEQILMDYPERPEFGDYTTNIAMILKGGRPLAEKIAENIAKGRIIEKVEVAGGGFLNIWAKNDYIINHLYRVISESEAYGNGKLYSNIKVMVEFTDPNPFKEFHIGHLYSNIVGETLSRLYESQGADVWRVCYQGDVGMHVAKSIWGMQQLAIDMPVESDSYSEKAKFLGRAYALGATAFEEDEAKKQQIVEINKAVYAKDPNIVNFYTKGKAWSLAYFDSIYERLGTKFKRFYFESQSGEIGAKLVQEGLDRGIFEKSEGAIVYKGESKGLHTRVFINSLGLPTYEAKELGLAPTKYADFPYQLSIILTGKEIDEYFEVLLTVLKEIRPDLAEKTRHVSHGMVRLPSGKMSSRTGKIITAEWLMDEAQSRADSLITSHKATENISDAVGLAAIKYALLKTAIGKDVEFDFDTSVSFEGSSGPYLQYTYARTQSILDKVDKKDIDIQALIDYDLSLEERSLLVSVGYLPEIVEASVSRLQPHLLSNYLFELAQQYNSFYHSFSVLSAEMPNQRNFRILLTQACGQTIKNGLRLLGIEAPDRM